MEAPVDKQVQRELGCGKSVLRSLPFCLGGADDNLARVRSDLVGKHVWSVILAAQLRVKSRSLFRADEGQGELPAGEEGAGDRVERHTRHRVPRVVCDGENGSQG